MSIFFKVILVFFLSFASFGSLASEAIALTPKGCAFVAQALEITASERDLGKPLSSQKQELASVPDLDPQLRSLISKELDRVYGVYTSLSPDRIGFIFFNRCLAAEGSIKHLLKDGQKI